MAKKKRKGNKHLGRPKPCDNPPGEPACLKQLKQGKSNICSNCRAPEVKGIVKQVFRK